MVFRFNGKKRTITGLLCLIALLGALPACDSGSTGSPAKNQTSAGVTPVQEVKVAMGDFFYKPGDITVKSGKVRFILTNVGATAHRFALTGEGVNPSSKNVGAGREGVLEVELRPGTYKMGCTLGDHEKRGSVGKLTVQ